MSVKLDEVSKALVDIAWKFGTKGLDGECCGKLTMVEYLALDKVRMTVDCSVQSVGQRLGFTKSGATRIVNRLEKRGYLKKLSSARDGRVCCVILTPEGESILKSAQGEYMKKVEKVVSGMPEEYSSKLAETLQAISRALE